MIKVLLYLIAVFFLSHIVLYAEPLTFDPPEWNLGDVAIGEFHIKEIRIRTTDSADSADSTDITNVRPACECLTVKVIRGKIKDESPPDQASRAGDGVISATLHIDNTLNAFFRVFFYAHTSDPKNPFTKFYITGRVKGKGLSNSEIVIFRTPMAKDYQEIQKLLGEMRDKNPSLVVKEYLAQDIDSTRLRAQFEKQYSLNRYADVEMFTSRGAFVGTKEIMDEITRMSNTKSSTTGLNGLTGFPLNQLNPVVSDLLFFYTVGCPGCREIREELFPTLRKKFTDKIVIIEYDIAEIENYKKLMAIEETLHIKSNAPRNNRDYVATAPVSLFIGQKALLGSKEILGKTEAVIANAIISPLTPASPTRGEVEKGPVADKIQERFLSFSVLAVIGAGLLDGINPCAFATIIFFISFLTFMGRSRKEIIIVGIFYTLAVFVTYLLLGIGAFKTLQTLSAYGIVARIILYLTSALVFCLGALSLYDLINYLSTRKTSGIALQLPLSIKQRIHLVIRGNLDSPVRGNDRTGDGKSQGIDAKLVIGALVIGFLVTLFEAVCTGQVYLPTIVFMLRDPQLKTNAFWYLVLYNLMFIVPLVAVFVMAYFGIGSQRLVEFSRRHLVVSKALLSAFFIGLGVVLLVV